MDFKTRFAQFSNPCYFSRVDANHILDLHIGINEHGQKSIEFRYPFTARKIKGTKAIEVSQYKNSNYNTLRFSLVEKVLEDLFYKFCDDIVEKTRNLTDAALGYNAIVERFALWKRMFVQSRDDLLSEEDVMGLMGEILYLRDVLFTKYGCCAAVEGWSGQDKTKKDFSYGNDWYETKAIHYNKTSVIISSLEQLESQNDGVLGVVLLEKMSQSYAGLTLNDLVWNVCSQISSAEHQDIFLQKVEKSGYSYNAAYDEYVFVKKSIRNFAVNATFPKMTPTSVPAGIISAKYELSLLSIADHEI